MAQIFQLGLIEHIFGFINWVDKVICPPLWPKGKRSKRQLSQNVFTVAK